MQSFSMVGESLGASACQTGPPKSVSCSNMYSWSKYVCTKSC